MVDIEQWNVIFLLRLEVNFDEMINATWLFLVARDGDIGGAIGETSWHSGEDGSLQGGKGCHYDSPPTTGMMRTTESASTETRILF